MSIMSLAFKNGKVCKINYVLSEKLAFNYRFSCITYVVFDFTVFNMEIKIHKN